MGLQNGIYGTRYDDGEPLYLTTERGVHVWDRVNRRWIDWASLVAKATAEEHTWQNREVGIPSIMWQLSNARTNGMTFAPGLDDTSGLASETITNGNDWTGADTGSGTTTPPTGWTMTNATCQNFSGTLNIHGDPITGGSMQQTVTTTPGAVYVAEVLVESDTTVGVRVAIDGVTIPIGPGSPKGSEIRALSFTAAEATTEIGIVIVGGGTASIGHIRVFLESELTGSGGAVAGIEAFAPVLAGPYVSGVTSYWIDETSGKVGFFLGNDPDSDLWMTVKEVCAWDDIEDSAKIDISASLLAHGCAKLPCVTLAGNMTAAYLAAKADP